MIESDARLIADWARHRNDVSALALHEMLCGSTDKPEIVTHARYVAALENWIEVFMNVGPDGSDTIH